MVDKLIDLSTGSLIIQNYLKNRLIERLNILFSLIGVKRITFDEFLPILAKIKSDTSSTGVKEDYIEGLKVRSFCVMSGQDILV